MAEEPKKRLGRKLLIAAVGVATVSYVAACGSNVESGTVPPAADAGADTFASSGNLMPPDTGTPDQGAADTSNSEAATDGANDAAMSFDVTSGNLVPPDTGHD